MNKQEFKQLIREEIRKVLKEATKKLPAHEFTVPERGWLQFDPKKVSVSDMKDLKKNIDAAVKQGILPKVKEFHIAQDPEMELHSIIFAKAYDPTVMNQFGINISKSSDFKKDLKKDVMHIFKQASQNNDMTDEINDELGDYFELIQTSKDSKLKNAYSKLRGEIDGSVANQAKYAKALLDLLK